MLHKNPKLIAPETFALIQELQAIPKLENYYLVGGTALTLQIGHRNSIDIDLFTTDQFEAESILKLLSKKFKTIATLSRKSTLLAQVNGIKVDFISHPYKIIKPIIKEENISMLSMEDICAMKLNATNSGQRLKDFIDVYYLLEHFSIAQMLEFYHEKYPHMNEIIPLRAITFFDDIDPQIDPPKLLITLPIKKIEARIIDAVKHSNKRF